MFALVRRVDLAEVIGAALVEKASGHGARTIAARLGRPVDTVRGWLRRFALRAEHIRAYFTVLLVDAGVDPVPPAAAAGAFADAVSAVAGAWSAGAFADAVSAVAGAWSAAASRWPLVGEVSP
ncbi:helix-turn-helix domain-containing protein [Streptomyces luteireticuli]|uniref:helix-turn-helix domain-containing protein n=1 Tax=Streptomyces luteireticuli TaxID=173858 RepID=UPI0035581C6A